MERFYRVLAAVAGALAVAWLPLAAAPAEEESEDVVIRVAPEGKPGTGAYLGLVLTEDTSQPEGGARVIEVIPDSPAEKAGIEEGDIIVLFRGRVIRGPAWLNEQVREGKPGEKVTITVIRGGDKRTLTAELGKRKAGRGIVRMGEGDEVLTIPLPDTKEMELELREVEKQLQEKEGQLGKIRVGKEWSPKHGRRLLFGYGRPRLGVELVEPTPELREFLGGAPQAGVLVGKVLPGSAAEKAGIRVGDLIVSVDGDKIEDADGLIESLDDKEGKTVEIELIRDRKPLRLKAAIPDVKDEEPTGPRAVLDLPWPPAPPCLPRQAQSI